MQLSIRRTELAQSVVITIVVVGSVALLGLVAGYWTWEWFAPRPEPRVQSQTDPSGHIASAPSLFGGVQKEGNVPAPTAMAIRLLGVVAATSGRDGYAVVVLDGKQILAAKEREEIAPGIRLAEVATDHVVLERDGAHETLAWPEKAATPEPAAQRPNR